MNPVDSWGVNNRGTEGLEPFGRDKPEHDPKPQRQGLPLSRLVYPQAGYGSLGYGRLELGVALLKVVAARVPPCTGSLSQQQIV